MISFFLSNIQRSKILSDYGYMNQLVIIGIIFVSAIILSLIHVPFEQRGGAINQTYVKIDDLEGNKTYGTSENPLFITMASKPVVGSTIIYSGKFQLPESKKTTIGADRTGRFVINSVKYVSDNKYAVAVTRPLSISHDLKFIKALYVENEEEQPTKSVQIEPTEQVHIIDKREPTERTPMQQNAPQPMIHTMLNDRDQRLRSRMERSYDRNKSNISNISKGVGTVINSVGSIARSGILSDTGEYLKHKLLTKQDVMAADALVAKKSIFIDGVQLTGDDIRSLKALI